MRYFIAPSGLFKMLFELPETGPLRPSETIFGFVRESKKNYSGDLTHLAIMLLKMMSSIFVPSIFLFLITVQALNLEVEVSKLGVGV